MMPSIVLALMAASAAGGDSSVWMERLVITGCDSDRRWGVSAYAINPDTQTVAVLRYARRDGPSQGQVRTEAPGDEIALLDLRDGREIATGPHLSSLFEVKLAISRDGRTVVALRKFHDTMYNSYDISMWKPYSDPENLKDYSLSGGSGKDGQSVQPRFCSFAASPPVVSPDGMRVALFGHEFTQRDRPTDELGDNALGVLDLETGKVTVMPVPNKTPVGPRQFWYLGWSSDGASLYAVLHGMYAGGRPMLTLYRFPLATKAAVRVGVVPMTTCGFGPDDDLIVTDMNGVGWGWGPHTAFGRLPIAKAERHAPADGDPAIRSIWAWLKLETVVEDNDPNFASFRQVFVGHKHTYADVDKKGTNGCTALVEQVTPVQTPR
jgi:hypothetical protein